MKEELKNKYIYEKDAIRPYGYKIWSLLEEAFKNKFSSMEFKEGYYFSSFDEIKMNKNERIQMCNLNKGNILYHVTTSASSVMIEGAKTLAIDILQVYLSLTKNITGIQLLYGKLVSKDDSETYIIGALSKDGRFMETGKVSYLGLKDGNYLVTSEFSSKILDIITEVISDEKGLLLSSLCAPVQIGIVPLKMNEAKVIPACKELNEKLFKAGYRVNVDFTLLSEKEKLENYLQMGVPLIIEIGPRDILNGNVEVIKRTDMNSIIVPLNRLEGYLSNMAKKVNFEIYNKQVKNVLARESNVLEKQQLVSLLNENKIVNVLWNGKESEYINLSSLKENTIIYLPFNQELFADSSIIEKTKPAYVLTLLNR